MKHYLSLFFALALLVPSAALAQTDEADGAPAQNEQGDAEPAQTGDDAAADEAEDDAEDAEEATEEEAEEAEDAEEAAEEAEEQAAEDQVEAVQAQQPEPEPEPETAATSGIAATGVASGELSTPAVESDVAEAQEEQELQEAGLDDDTVDEGLEEERLPWRNSLFLWDNEVSTTTFDGGSSTLSYNPYYAMAFSLRPRWYFTEDISVRLRQDLSIEMTDTDTRVRNQEPVLADTLIDLVHGNLYELEGAVLSAGARLSLPTSIASRAYSKYFGIGPNVAISRPFEDVLEGMTLGISGSYSYTFAGSNVREADADYSTFPQRRACPQGSGVDCFDAGESVAPQASGTTTVDHAATFALQAAITPVENLSFDTSFTWWWTNGRGLATACHDVLTGDVCVEDESDTHLRLATWFTLSANYQFIDWLGASLNYSHLTAEHDPDGSRRNPFWSVDSTVSLTASVTLDKLYGALSGQSSSPTEVVEEGNDDQQTATAAAPTVGASW